MSVEFKDYYKILGVERGADEKAIKSAYRRLARKHHPDVAKGKGAADRFREIAEAYAVLSDPDKRRRYDTLGPDWQRHAGSPAPGPGGVRVEWSGGDLGDFSEFFRTIFADAEPRAGARGRRPGTTADFDDLFGDGFRQAERRGRARGQDVQASIQIALEDAFHGARKTLGIELDEPCRACQGAGHVDGKACAACRGGGWERRRHEVDVKIPPGVRTGQRVRVSGEGGSGPTGARGDLYLAVTVAPHPVFERRGDDLHVTLPIAAPEAALGATIDVPTLRGRVSMKIPPGTSSGRTFRLPGYGMPRLRGGGSGDQLVTVRIVVPATLTPEERDLYARLRALRTDNPREDGQG